ncbi:type VI secretion system accessory protein TagJ [Paraburkholderia sp. J67]|uniref:type VI secretion system accessory protein TagJ n=1 Tax=Paraburkholderia sp. J67 TaxID=2805435 RepID=UPI002ABDC6B1|nr:type VI secretion system accessory protein TagJ [Paraburkholderia sp. J67]
MTHPVEARLFSQQAGHQTVAERIAAIESQVRLHPGDAQHRWALFQWLCIGREWERAIRQLQVFGQVDASNLSLVQACRDLVRAERWREDVMLGRKQPGYVIDDAPQWVQGMIDALVLTARGEVAAADDLREQALDAAPSTPGRGGDVSFEWIADSDTRLGPVCEIMTAGSYRWLPFDEIADWKITQPTTLVDLVWAPCSIRLHDGTVVRGFVPSRYPLPPLSTPSGIDRDALDLGRQTMWHEVGRTAVIAVGHKCWTTSIGDVGLFDWPACAFGAESKASALVPGEVPQSTPTNSGGSSL